MPTTTLTHLQRHMLSNQYRILEALYPQEAPYIAQDREAIERGYEAEYDRIITEPLGDPLSEDDCEKIIEILQMHRALRQAWDRLNPQTLVEDDITFNGFDGNNEISALVYTRYLLKTRGLWIELHQTGHDYNTHFPTAELYNRMLVAWNQSANRSLLSLIDLERIIAARRYPE